MSTPTPTSWPAGFVSAPPSPRPVTMDNAISFGFKIAIGMTLWFLPFGVVASLLLTLIAALFGVGTRIH